MFPEERQRQILEQMRSGTAVTVAELAARFGVSESTIRRDLRQLAESGLLERTHGGALPSQGTLHEPTFAEKTGRNLDEKQAIAQAAVALIEDGDSIILDAGTTTLQIARLLRQRPLRLTVVTNAVPIATELGNLPGMEVMVTGGTVKENTLALVGPAAERALEEVNVDKVFLGTNGFDLDRGLTTPTLAEAEVKRRMIQAARQVVVVADHTKWGQVAFATIAPLSQVQTLITDAALDPEVAAELERRGMQVIRAGA